MGDLVIRSPKLILRGEGMIQFITVVGVLFTASAYAGGGGWGSSGGELLRDMQNPWWVKNTSEVRYCIQVDEKSLSLNVDQIPAMIELAISYWQKEFNTFPKYLDESFGYEPLFKLTGVGSQSFKKTECDGSEDLRFQFGFGTLTEEQRKKLVEPRNYVEVAVRTEYDEEQLRGKGFIFIASDVGPNAFYSNPNMIERPWRYGSLVVAELIHGLGHVFGIPHVGEKYSLMSQQFPEMLLDKSSEQEIAKATWRELPAFFRPPNSFRSCFTEERLPVDVAKSFFGLSGSPGSCITFEINEQTREILIQETQENDTKKVTVGKITGAQYAPVYNPAVQVILTDKQKVFNDAGQMPFQIGSLVFGPAIIELEVSGGLFKKSDGSEIPVLLRLTPNLYRIFGLSDGRIQEIFGTYYDFRY